jgi:hypothetical protein
LDLSELKKPALSRLVLLAADTTPRNRGVLCSSFEGAE